MSSKVLRDAAEQGDVEAVRALLAQGAAVDEADPHKRWTALHSAAEGHLECVRVRSFATLCIALMIMDGSCSSMRVRMWTQRMAFRARP